MRGPSFSGRSRLGLVLIAVVAAIALFPLRLALGMARAGITARDVHGSIWLGRVNGLAVGGVYLGDVEAAISPAQLFVGRVRLTLWRETGAVDDIAGAWTSGFNLRGIDDVTGAMPAEGLFAPLPLNSLEFDDVTVHFAGDTCAVAAGTVRARISGQYAGLNLSRGLSGVATCDGQAVLFPLVSQTGLEKLSLRFWRDGRYTAQVAVRGGAGSNVAALIGAGLTLNGGDYVMNLEGRM